MLTKPHIHGATYMVWHSEIITHDWRMCHLETTEVIHNEDKKHLLNN